MIGAFCINFDIIDCLNSISLLKGFVQTTNQRGAAHTETFASSVNETIEALMEQVVNKIGGGERCEER